MNPIASLAQRLEQLRTKNHRRSNKALMQKLKKQFPLAQSQLIPLLQQKQLNQQQLNYIHKKLSTILSRWVIIELDEVCHSNLTNLSSSNRQPVDCDSLNSHTHITSLDYSLKCQLSSRIPSTAARTDMCRFLCIVDKKILESTGVCSCGRETEPYQNEITEDWVLELAIQFSKHYFKSNANLQQLIQDKEKVFFQKQQAEFIQQKNPSNTPINWKGLIRIFPDQNSFSFIQQ